MEFQELIRQRRSVRQFRPKPVEEEKLKEVLEAARLAPSAHNWQAYKIIVVRNPTKRQKLAAACVGQGFVAQAPVVLVFCADQNYNDPRERQLYSIQDATIACYQAWLAAVNLGLAGVWVGAFFEDEISKVLELPSHLLPVAVLPLGYPAETPPPRPRKPITELVETR